MAIGAYAIERDYSQYVAYASNTVLAIVGTASKGPINEATVITTPQELVTRFGPLKTDYYGLYAGQYFLSQASKLYYVRAASDSAAAPKVTVPGLDADASDVAEALVIELNEKGTYGNGYSLNISVAQDSTYNLVLKNSKSLTLETISGLSLDDLIVGYASNYFKVSSKDDTVASIADTTLTFAGGNDGIEDIQAGDYINAAQSLTKERVDINLISVPGVSDPSVVVAVLSIAENRGDCLYLVDCPKGLTRDGVIQWRTGGGSYNHAQFNSSFGALYYDWVTIYDSVNKVNVEVPPSVPVAASIAYTDRVYEVWYAPAGLTRGIIRGVLNTNSDLTKSDVELLYESGINAIYEDPQVGLVIWGQKTLLNEDTSLNRVNVRKLMNYLKKIISAAANYLVFEPNDRVTWNSFKMKVMPVLKSVENRRGIYDFRIVSGDTIITDNDIDNYKMPCMIMIQPTKTAEEIPIYFTLTSTGADFNEILESNGIS